MNPVLRAVLDSGVIELGNFTFADGKRANNKLNFDHLFESKNRENLSVVLHHLAHVIERFEPELLVGIPSGGTELADELAKPAYLDLPVTYLDKDKVEPGNKTFKYREESDRERVYSVEGLAVVEDVFTRLTSTIGALAVPGILERTKVVAGVWDRDYHPSRITIPVPLEAMITEQIPYQLNEYHELYSYARRSEIGE